MKNVKEHSINYPLMQPQDVAKLLYQREFGPGHFIEDEELSFQRLEREYHNVNQETPQNHNPIESIGNGFVRYSLKGIREEQLEIMNKLFVLSANRKTGSKCIYEKNLQSILENFDEFFFSFSKQQYREYIEEQKIREYPMVSHSQKFNEAYQPAYRLIDERYAYYMSVFLKISQLQKKDSHLIIGIDGNSAAGKTTLAQCIAEIFNCDLIHMDDFFLPMALRTEERLKEAGGNVHYERFLEEVISGIQSKREFSYRVFSCHEMNYTGKHTVDNKRMIVIEGAYSMRKEYRDIYDYKIFMEIPYEVQLARIQKRNGNVMCKVFQEKWIPMENVYFDTFNVKAICDEKVSVY